MSAQDLNCPSGASCKPISSTAICTYNNGPPGPPPPPPAPGHGHYGDPSAGPCQLDEKKVQIQGMKSDFCSPDCSSGPCPTDVPAGTTASPECALETQGASRPSRCALICTSGSKCPAKASCKMVQGAIGLCTYDS